MKFDLNGPYGFQEQYVAANSKFRAPDKSVYWKFFFFISHPKHMLWVIKRTVSIRQFI